MVAANVPRLGYVPKVCLARPMLFAALECLDRGDTIGAGVRLREAVDRFLKSACHWYGLKVKAKRTRPAQHASALREAGILGSWGMGVVLECTSAGNSLAHCKKVDAATVRNCISCLFGLMDGEPYVGNERKPIATTYKGDQAERRDDEDDDDGDVWKAGAV